MWKKICLGIVLALALGIMAGCRGTDVRQSGENDKRTEGVPVKVEEPDKMAKMVYETMNMLDSYELDFYASRTFKSNEMDGTADIRTSVIRHNELGKWKIVTSMEVLGAAVGSEAYGTQVDGRTEIYDYSEERGWQMEKDASAEKISEYQNAYDPLVYLDNLLDIHNSENEKLDGRDMIKISGELTNEGIWKIMRTLENNPEEGIRDLEGYLNTAGDCTVSLWINPKTRYIHLIEADFSAYYNALTQYSLERASDDEKELLSGMTNSMKVTIIISEHNNADDFELPEIAE